MKGLPGYLLYRALSGLFGLLPAPAMRGAGRGIGFGLGLTLAIVCWTRRGWSVDARFLGAAGAYYALRCLMPPLPVPSRSR